MLDPLAVIPSPARSYRFVRREGPRHPSTLLVALHNRPNPAETGRVKGGPKAHPAGTGSALRATRPSRHPRPAVERRCRPEQDREGVRILCHESAASPQIVRKSAESGHDLPVASNGESTAQQPYSTKSRISTTPANRSRRTGRLVRRPDLSRSLNRGYPLA